MTIIPKKKDVLQELAISLFLMLEFNPDTASYSVMARVREKAAEALHSAAVYTGTIGQADVEKFLNTKQLDFTIPCRRDIVKGDILQFTEDAYDSRRQPPRWLGKRQVTAEVTAIRPSNGQPMLIMKVIHCVGVWELKIGQEIHRLLKSMARSDVRRAAWDNEDERRIIKDRKPPNPKTIREAATEVFKYCQ